MPIRTMFEISRGRSPMPSPGSGHSPRSSRAIITWPMISPAVRLRTSFCVPVWQKEQVSVAAHLAGNAQRPAIGLGDVDHLDLVAAGDADKVFPRPVGRDVAAHHLGHLDHESLFQIGAVGLAQVRHRVEVARAPDVDSTARSAPCASWPAFSGVPAADQGLAHRVTGQPDQVDGPLGGLARKWSGHPA